MTHKLLSARLTLLAREQGGRSHAVGSGYRSIFRFDGVEDLFGVELTMAADIAPGRNRRCTGMGLGRRVPSGP
jgi:hypothetical protein